MGLAQAELAIVRIEEPIAADLILERQRLSLELDSVFAIDLRPRVQGGCLRFVGVTELEHDLWIARSETVNVRDPPAQNERIAIERKVRRIHENDFPDFRTQARRLVF